MNKKKPLTFVQKETLFCHERTLVAVANSFLKHFGVKPFHETLPELDRALINKKKVALFLFDAAGKAILKSVPDGRYFLEHSLAEIHSVNPSTTVAATTALLSGKFPSETGYIGWSIYFPELKEAVDVFPNRYSSNHLPLPSGYEHYMNKRCPYESIFSLINKQGHMARSIFPGGVAGVSPLEASTISALGVKASKAFHDLKDLEFLYVYCTEPDSTLHEYGVKTPYLSSLIKEMKETIIRFKEENPDVFTLVLADHGQINVEWQDLSKIKEIDEVLLAKPFLDARFASFLIKEGGEEQFERAFRANFPSFFLFSKKEALQKGLFGQGEPLPFLRESLGPYIAVSYGNIALYASRFDPNGNDLVGHHAGVTKEEKEIVLSSF